MIIDRYTGRTVDDLKRDEGALRSVLTDAGTKFRGRACCCVFCSDKHPSAGIYSSNGDGFRFKCHACGFQGDILDVISKLDGVEVAEVFRRLKGDSQPQRQISTVYSTIEALKAAIPYPVESVFEYTHPNTGKPELLVLRLKTSEGKTFRQAHPVPASFAFGGISKPWPLYNRRR